MSNIKKIIEEYIEAVIKHEERTKEGNWRLANDQYKIIEENITELKLVQDGINELEDLLEHKSDWVRLWSSRYLLSSKEEKAKHVLLELIDKSGVLGFTAKVTLDEWNNGNIH